METAAFSVSKECFAEEGFPNQLASSKYSYEVERKKSLLAEASDGVMLLLGAHTSVLSFLSKPGAAKPLTPGVPAQRLAVRRDRAEGSCSSSLAHLSQRAGTPNTSPLYRVPSFNSIDPNDREENIPEEIDPSLFLPGNTHLGDTSCQVI